MQYYLEYWYRWDEEYSGVEHIHRWNDYDDYYDFFGAYDFDQTVYASSSVLAPAGAFSSQFVLNDNNTQYIIYVEGFSASGAYGQ